MSSIKNIVIILVGVSGSGKTTWTTNYIKTFKNTLRINRDSLRQMLVGNLDGYYKRKDLNTIETEITCAEIDIADNLVLNAYDIILDNTNLKPSHVDRWVNYFQKRNYNIEFKFFDIDLKQAKDRIIIRDFLYKDSTNIEDNVKYLDKQYLQYHNVKNHIINKYPNNII